MSPRGSSRNWRMRFETVGSISAIVVGLAALVIAWDQGRVMRAQQHGEVYPALQVDAFTSTQTDTFSLGLRVSNNGVGPAFIENSSILLDGEPQALDALISILPENLEDRSWMAMEGRSVAPGQTVEAFSVSWNRDAVDDAVLAKLLSQWDRWDVEICYCSVFDRCWTATANDMRRDAVDSCPVIEGDVFEEFGRAAYQMENLQ